MNSSCVHLQAFYGVLSTNLISYFFSFYSTVFNTQPCINQGPVRKLETTVSISHRGHLMQRIDYK